MWEAGYEHGDISLGNLMYRGRDKNVGEAGNERGIMSKGKGKSGGRVGGGGSGGGESGGGRTRTRSVIGILHDWDLATWRDDPSASGGLRTERTCTIPYAALDIFKDWEKPFRRRYRHDLESFGWCLDYFCLDHPTNRDFLNLWHNPEHSWAHRFGYLVRMDKYRPREGFEDLYLFAQSFMRWVMAKADRPNKPRHAIKIARHAKMVTNDSCFSSAL